MFAETPVMSPYLLAFAVSDFIFSSLKLGSTLHRIYTRPDIGAIPRTQFALRNSDLFLKELERYVNFKYELTKVDQIALPDFQSGLFIINMKYMVKSTTALNDFSVVDKGRCVDLCLQFPFHAKQS